MMGLATWSITPRQGCVRFDMMAFSRRERVALDDWCLAWRRLATRVHEPAGHMHTAEND